jgi:hypothetical protein
MEQQAIEIENQKQVDTKSLYELAKAFVVAIHQIDQQEKE